jgi:hypothetical protein
MVWLAVLTKKNSVVVSIDRKAAKCQNNTSTDCEILRLPSSPSPQQNRIADVQLSTSRQLSVEFLHRFVVPVDRMDFRQNLAVAS